MKTQIEQTSSLSTLKKELEKYTKIPKNVHNISKKPITAPQQNKEIAAKKIQKLWRRYQVKEAFVKDSYSSYISIIDPQDEQYLLSSIMFGRHEAELRKDAKDRINNPYIHESAYYHRCDNLSGVLLDQIKSEFSISSDQLKDKVLIPVMSMKTVSIDSLNIRNIEVIKGNSEQNISIILAPTEIKNSVRSRLTSAGLIATPWEIAQHVKGLKTKQIKETLPKIKNTTYLQDLPNTKDGLLKSTIFNKVKKTAYKTGLPTRHLAASLIQLIEKDTLLTPEAITRIALIIDMANTFYIKNYPRYAFCVYAIIHELSLAMAKQTENQNLNQEFQRFLTEAKHSLSHSLNIDENKLNNSTFIASPAASGTNAFMIAKRIASTLQNESGHKPSIKMYKPCYYELKTDEFSEPSLLEEPDIFVFSTGPIVNMDGLTPGVDINQFVREQIINKNRKKPTTLIIDATTTLYKNLTLDDSVKELVEKGDLSIIVFESHQKFGLLHTDQAQYGRLFGWCGKNYSREKLAQIQQDAQVDFNNHLDLRIGANINHCCNDILEEIKQQHFSNGALFRTIFTQANLILHKIVNHQYMAKNLNELYFVTPNYSWRPFERVIPYRNSFGHYTTTLSGVGSIKRLCANASDQIDSLITSSKVYLALNSCDGEQIFLEHGKKLGKLSEAEQIISIAITSNRINNTNQPQDLITKIQYYCTLSNVLKSCGSLKGRSTYEEISRYYYQLEKTLLAETDTHEFRPDFLQATKIAYSDNFFSEENLKYFKLSRELCQFVILTSSCSIQLNNEIINHLSESPGKLNSFLKKGQFFIDNKELFKLLAKKNVSLDYKVLESLALTEGALPCLKHLIKNNFPIDSTNIKILANPNIIKYINDNESLPNDSITILATLNLANITMNEQTMNLINDKDFKELISLVYKTSQDILNHLERADNNSNKYKESLKYTPSYLNDCFCAIINYKKDTKSSNNHQLIQSINNANQKYTNTALKKDRSFVSILFKSLISGLIAFFDPCAAKQIVHHGIFATKSTKKLTAMTVELDKLTSPIKIK